MLFYCHGYYIEHPVYQSLFTDEPYFAYSIKNTHKLLEKLKSLKTTHLYYNDYVVELINKNYRGNTTILLEKDFQDNYLKLEYQSKGHYLFKIIYNDKLRKK